MVDSLLGHRTGLPFLGCLLAAHIENRSVRAASFLLKFVRAPTTVGAVAPSGPAPARVAAVPRTGSPVVVELGTGTGAFTDAIQRRLAGRGQHIAVGINPRFAQQPAALHPAVDIVNTDAADLAAVLAQRGLSQTDVVVSGLPWAAFTENQQRDVLAAVVAVLPPHGVFTTFAYVRARWAPPARAAAILAVALQGGRHQSDGVGRPPARAGLLVVPAWPLAPTERSGRRAVARRGGRTDVPRVRRTTFEPVRWRLGRRRKARPQQEQQPLGVTPAVYVEERVGLVEDLGGLVQVPGRRPRPAERPVPDGQA
ncbi:class I SAM-dependent methyltransferase [Streptosporangium sp. G11]|uniref:class I SAM-dependent methyltransferase n=1 Tax=Streptosporangium sp. G11 TaxID=3436926 RepID=UPI003EB81F23